MITFVTFKWNTPGYRSKFLPQHVNVLRRSVARNYPRPHRFVCITDDPRGLDPEVATMRLWSDHSNLQSPHGPNFPSCYRRLKIFAADARRWLGDEIVLLDLDTVIVGDLTPIVDRDEDFVAWSGTSRGGGYNCSLVRLRAGTRRHVWESFDPVRSPKMAAAAGFVGSDQGWISYILGKGKEATYTQEDGVYCYKLHIKTIGGVLPKNARVVFWNGRVDPWDPEARRLPWVQEHHR